ncbi:hypothetical protein TraAM80_08551 [Trypanosoma rangeli]|uniref:Uncharacterized protein n=1 Tax=Trypanosoma rangeli TaxID=5698 RepID=A0A3R7RAG0_TRYRA|nr:uncharacterized protein TraAM80_08551 [Trypanosoma rangeli]RNE98811.1 hypothetical protein TraAM80_08551 [Trypanosoma rangeli]|eukprot:RNE98811.1 hypothetical protein TraAM80_08551 [Trypanosoma rangeli]
MGQHVSSCSANGSERGRNSSMPHDGTHRRFPHGLVSEASTNVRPTPLPAAEAAVARSSWISVTESALTCEWQAGREGQRMGVASTSPHISLTCAVVPFPENRSSGIWHTTVDARAIPEIPVGKDFFSALRSAWRKGAPAGERQEFSSDSDACRSYSNTAFYVVEDPYAGVMSPPVPLWYAVSEVLVPQWTEEGLFDAPALRNNR